MRFSIRNRRAQVAAVLMLACPLLASWIEPAAAARVAGSTWGSDYFPNVALTTQDGQPVLFFDDLIKDKVVAINFIYTSCGDSCPLETARLLNVQRLLGDRVGKDIFFYSITIDPVTDTAEVLKNYRDKFKVGPGWIFLTGKQKDIIKLRQRLGLYIAEIQGGDSNDHNLSLIIGNQKTGRWMKRSPFENPYILASELANTLHNWEQPGKKEQDYASAPELRNITPGESLFRTRCAACHTIGNTSRVARERQVGPDLAGVTLRRERVWLEEWLAAPDRMLAAKDPIATALLAEYRIPMPNLRLNPKEIGDLLEYLESESRIVQAEAKARAAEPHRHAPDVAPHAH